MVKTKQNLDGVRHYYCTNRAAGPTERTILDIWESGGAFNDSITPSTYVPEYRSHIALKLLSLTPDESTIFSIGCGNGFVEGDLVRSGRSVRAIDYLEEAVHLARNKGVDAFAADFFDLGPEDVVGASAVYADGLLGHLLTGEDGARPAVEKLASLELRPGSFVVISNDSPRSPTADFAPHEKVPGFWFVSRAYVEECLTEVGFEVVESYYFPYVRPLSGLRNRTMCVALVP